jgi:hypothetical protein
MKHRERSLATWGENMLDCVGCLHQTGSRLHEERRLAPPGSEGAPACAPSRVRPPGQPRRRKRRSRRCATCRRRLGRPCSDRRRPRRREKETEPHHDPAPLAVANRGRPPRAARRCPQASAPPSATGSSARPHGGARRWSLEQMSRRRWSRTRRWCGLPASVAAGEEIGDGVGPPVFVAAGSVPAQTLGRGAREKSRGKMRRERNEWMRSGGTSG